MGKTLRVLEGQSGATHLTDLVEAKWRWAVVRLGKSSGLREGNVLRAVEVTSLSFGTAGAFTRLGAGPTLRCPRLGNSRCRPLL